MGTEYVYTSANANTYSISYCLSNKVNDLPSGVAVALPGSINVSCSSESDAAFCARLGANCGTKSGADSCGNVKTNVNCGSCDVNSNCVSNTCVVKTWQVLGSAGNVGNIFSNNITLAVHPTSKNPYLAFSNSYTQGISSIYTSDWGGSVYTTGGSSWASIGFRPPANYQYVAFSDNANNYKATVKYTTDNVNWTTLGAAGFSANNAGRIKLAFSPTTNLPYVAYPDGGKLTVSYYNGSVWTNVGSASFSSEDAMTVALAFKPGTNTPYVAYKGNVNNKVTVMSYDGSNWVLVGSANFSNTVGGGEGGDQRVPLAFNPLTNQPCIAYNNSVDYKLSVMCFDGSNWNLLGSQNFTSSTAFYLAMAFNPITNAPYVSYFDGGFGGKVSVKYFDGTNWLNVGVAGFSPTRAYSTELSFDSAGQPYVAYMNDATPYQKAVVMTFK